MAKLYKFDTTVQAAACQPRGRKYVDNGIKDNSLTAINSIAGGK